MPIHSAEPSFIFSQCNFSFFYTNKYFSCSWSWCFICHTSAYFTTGQADVWQLFFPLIHKGILHITILTILYIYNHYYITESSSPHHHTPPPPAPMMLAFQSGRCGNGIFCCPTPRKHPPNLTSATRPPPSSCGNGTFNTLLWYYFIYIS